jgi:hypothetical protein
MMTFFDRLIVATKSKLIINIQSIIYAKNKYLIKRKKERKNIYTSMLCIKQEEIISVDQINKEEDTMCCDNRLKRN